MSQKTSFDFLALFLVETEEVLGGLTPGEEGSALGTESLLAGVELGVELEA